MSTFTYNTSKKMIDLFIGDITGDTNFYYMFASKFNDWTDDTSPDAEKKGPSAAHFTPHKEMLFGKKITSSDLSKVIVRNTWAGNTKYDHYDHRDESLYDKTFFVINSSNDVFKCLFNANTNSTVEPSTKSNTAFTLADGYTWKYMYTVSSEKGNKFGDLTRIPLVVNSTITTTATNGSIETVFIENPGLNYTGYSNGTLQYVVSNTVYRIDTTAQDSNGYYSNSALYVTSGTGQGNLVTITDYVSNSTGKYVTIDPSTVLDLTSEYLISPRIKIDGDGSGAKAYCTVNTATYSVDKVVMIDTGSNYSRAEVGVYANNSYGSNAIMNPIMSPTGGHGADIETELGSDVLSISVDFANNEVSTVPTEIKFRTGGYMINPLYYSNTSLYNESTFDATTSLNIQSINGLFEKGEKLTGQTSNASGYIAWSNTSVVKLCDVTGTFVNNEIVISSNTDVAANTTAINNSNIKHFSGNVLYFDNVSEIQRSNTSTESIKIYLRF